MHWLSIQRLLGLLLMLFSVTLLPPVVVAWFYQDGQLPVFLSGMAAVLMGGAMVWLPARRFRDELRVRDGFLFVTLFWVVLGLAGALPFAIATTPHLSPTDAVFESFSGLTTTGATVITGLDDLPPSILFYRQQLQWLGGMGIIVLAVAIMPMLGVGGMQLYRAETPGPIKDNKLTPRITETAKALWYIYLSLTIVCALGYWAAGMSVFDAISHSFSTIAIGGFSTHDQSIGYFQSSAIEMIAVVFMLLSGMNFALHFMAWRSLSIRYYWRDSELRVYLAVLASVTMITVGYLYYTDTFIFFNDALHAGLFQAVSIGTTTGFTTEDYFIWPGFLPVLLLFVSFIGGCAGSTGGGMKVIRFLLVLKQGRREIVRLIHPNAQIPVKVGGKPMPDRVVTAVWGFFAAYVGSFVVIMLFLMATGLDQITAFSAVAACMNNLGPGLGGVGANYVEINDAAKWALSFAMMLGRLEIFTLLILFTGAFWRR
ncbi:MAG: TrkH family potassium uptake protein [Gammaproteobacteria bacterium]|nr:TrkH family potassium uptake protein [Gammaproteobacteria bacterium]MDH5513947.1 TrkH family potassium uptake protein [Gammaproteobacteria bacterium]